MQLRKNPFIPKDRPLYIEHTCITTFVFNMSHLAGEILTFKKIISHRKTMIPIAGNIDN